MRKSSNPALNLALNPATYWWLELGNCSLNLQCRKHHKNSSLIQIVVKGLCVGNGTHLGGTTAKQSRAGITSVLSLTSYSSLGSRWCWGNRWCTSFQRLNRNAFCPSFFLSKRMMKTEAVCVKWTHLGGPAGRIWHSVTLKRDSVQQPKVTWK